MRAPPGRQITFVEAVVHAFYDTTDKLLDTVNDEYERILAITEDRARRREQLYLTGPASASHVPRIESRQHEALKALSSSPSSSSS
jgi:CBS-domain-containing membrane protein